jgi:hypothetical protein
LSRSIPTSHSDRTAAFVRFLFRQLAITGPRGREGLLDEISEGFVHELRPLADVLHDNAQELVSRQSLRETASIGGGDSDHDSSAHAGVIGSLGVWDRKASWSFLDD